MEKYETRKGRRGKEEKKREIEIWWGAFCRTSLRCGLEIRRFSRHSIALCLLTASTCLVKGAARMSRANIVTVAVPEVVLSERYIQPPAIIGNYYLVFSRRIGGGRGVLCNYSDNKYVLRMGDYMSLRGPFHPKRRKLCSKTE